MKGGVKKNITVAIIIINVTIGFFLLKSRSFSHLAIWNIIESERWEDLYWAPEGAPRYFRFEPYNDKIYIFRNELLPLIKDESDEFKIVLKVATRVMEACSGKIQSRLSLKWDSPEGMLRQIREGAGANCFHRSILFSTYLSSLGMKSRLWALENENFDAISHTVTEVYIKDFKKWIFIDVMSGFYVTEYGKPLSFLELREKLLSGGTQTISVRSIYGNTKELPSFYRRLIKFVFLRADNDFANKYNARVRYGALSIFHKQIDKLPDNIRRGLSYLLGRRDGFIHYVDRFSRSLKSKIIIARLFFYFFIVSTIAISITLPVALVVRVFSRKSQ